MANPASALGSATASRTTPQTARRSELFFHRMPVGQARSAEQDVVDAERPRQSDVDETQLCVGPGDRHRRARLAPSGRSRDGDAKQTIGNGVHARVNRRSVARLFDPLHGLEPIGANLTRKDGLDLPFFLEHAPVAIEGIGAHDVARVVDPYRVMYLVLVFALRNENQVHYAV